MIEFRVSNLRVDRSAIIAPADVLIRVTGDLEIVSDATPICCETDFPVVELAVEASEWLHTGLTDGTDFEFDSMSTPEPGWVWFRWDHAGGWRVGGLHQDRADPSLKGSDELRVAVRRLVYDLKENAGERLSIDLTPFLGEV